MSDNSLTCEMLCSTTSACVITCNNVEVEDKYNDKLSAGYDDNKIIRYYR